MSEFLTPGGLEEALREIGRTRYHNLHPFHRLLHGGKLDRGQVQAWALNRFYYQSRIPAKDAALLARLPTAELRREWRRRLEDHDGHETSPGGVARWKALAVGVGLDPEAVESTRLILPATRFAVDAYVNFVRERSILEAIASSLTEMFSPNIIAERVSGMLANYDWITQDTLAYFTPRLTQAPRDVDFALAYVQQHADTPEKQQAVLAALRFKCDVLWSQLDALYFAYVEPGFVPPGAFTPAPERQAAGTLA
ncbi:pyrroloquinoline-quinone synthase PqqC [Phenylobacterium deserti]|uniref:Pyrroloquinoline-quinone synthase n=1 Tax=Phenylobacterium deserti TaxID=1914756 RepID=A0A328A8R5_9CAUL|nr:pyrroloquinoline-quinone synthase PqqC [Phenylobacterium deserti]RAK50941.1 pyrroloquinoline quinone biosynthesis protein C [Phenylobacterium deserti]